MTAGSMPQNVMGGVMLIIATALAISVQDVVFKLFSGSLTLWQIFAMRGVLALILLLAISGLRGNVGPVLGTAFGPWPLLRSLCLTMTFLAFYAAIPFLSLSTVGAANYIAPIFVALLSARIIGEPVSRFGWIGVFLGFAGVLVLLRPGTDAFSGFALLPVCGAAFYAVGHVITRTRCQSVPTEALAFSLNAMMCAAGFLVSIGLLVVQPNQLSVDAYPYLLETWSSVGLTDGLILVLLACFAVGNGLMLATAYKIAPPAKVATFEYSYLVFVAAWDILVFGISPTPMTIAGIAMIVVAGLLVMRR